MISYPTIILPRTDLLLKYRIDFIDNFDIIAPKLKSINSDSLIDTYKMVKKYPTIKRVARLFRINGEDFERSEFAEAYRFLRNYDFDLMYENDVIFYRGYFDMLIDLESEVFNSINNTDISGSTKPRSRFYRSIHALVNFVPTAEHSKLFDLYNVTVVTD